ncbi:MAG: 3-hydroxyacyl-ACP dehydratase FabZ [Rhodospirillales bacterium]|nr:3-hydroxyacyl-ACP dehydratase FabZ [Rhodospirillales bacterium]
MDADAKIMTGEVIDLHGIQRMIPHRYPMLMIEKMVDVVPNVRATGLKNVSINEWFFQGHFPSEPVMPGVLIIEAMAQTAAVLVVKTLGPEKEGRLTYFMSIDQARFRKPVVPGDTIRILVEKQRHRGSVWRFSGCAQVDGTTVAEAVYTAMIRDS